MQSVRVWNQELRLSAEERGCVGELNKLLADRPLPGQAAPPPTTAATADQVPGTGPAPGASWDSEQVLETPQQFFAWFAGMSSTLDAQDKEDHGEYLRELDERVGETEALLEALDGALFALDEVRGHHARVEDESARLHGECEALLREKTSLVAGSESIRTRLAFFDAADEVYRVFDAPQVDAGSERFVEALRQLDSSLAFVAANRSYKDAPTYLLRLRSLQHRGLGILRDTFVRVMRTTVSGVLEAMKDGAVGLPAGTVPAAAAGAGGGGEQTATSELYVQFRANAPSLAPLVAEVEARSRQPEYASLLASLHDAFFAARMELLPSVLEAQLAGVLDESDIVESVRSGSLVMLRVSGLEHALFSRFFTVPSGGIPCEWFDVVAEPLYSWVRSYVIQQTDVDVLVDLASVLKQEILEGHIEAGVDAGGILFTGTARRLLSDVQERLFYRAQTAIRDGISGFVPGPGDVAYPERLVRHRAVFDSGAAGGRPAPYEDWYPTLRDTLMSLSKLYRSVDIFIFQGLALEYISECTHSLVRASETVTRGSGAQHGQLFLIKHLLILREQISPFDVEFRVKEKSLDFSHLSSRMASVVSSASSLFSLSSSNTLISLVTGATPEVVESELDAKEVLEAKLKAACEAFIIEVQTAALGPGLDLMEAVSSRLAAAGGPEANVDAILHGAAMVDDALVQQVVADVGLTAERVDSVIAELAAALDESINNAALNLALYLANVVTHKVLVDPIKNSAVDLAAQLAVVCSWAGASASPLTTGPGMAAVFDRALAAQQARVQRAMGMGPRSVVEPVVVGGAGAGADAGAGAGAGAADAADAAVAVTGAADADLVVSDSVCEYSGYSTEGSDLL